MLEWAYVSPAYLIPMDGNELSELGGDEQSSPAGSPRTPGSVSISVASTASLAQSSALAPLSSCVRSRLTAPKSFQRSGSAAESSTVTEGRSIACPKCQLRKSADGSICKGASVWCLDCNLAYNNVQSRWQKSSKLKTWWHSLAPEAQVAWFRKWGGMTSKQRFDAISYIETTVKAFEAIEDELDHFMTFAVWEEKKQAARWSDERILKEWTAIVESQRDECLWRRNQWLIPRFEGVHRIKRQRTSQEILASRHASITDSSQIAKLWSAGEASLQQFGASIQATVATGTHVEGPSLHVRPGTGLCNYRSGALHLAILKERLP